MRSGHLGSFRSAACLALAVGFLACGDGGGGPLAAPETPFPSPTDPPAPPTDPGTPVPPPDPGTPPSAPPPDPGTPPVPPPPPPPLPPADPPVHTGIPFGPSVYTKNESSISLIPPAQLSSTFNALLTDAHLPILMEKLEAARRTDGRILLSFAGSSGNFTDANGFNLAQWKQRVDQFRGLDLSSYIADGTLMGHFIMDEPSDPSNWNGHVVPVADLDEMARYSKEIWPDLPAIIRAWPDYLKGYDFKYLDAAWAQYHARFDGIDQFIEENVRDAKASKLAIVLGLNVLAGGGSEGILGYHNQRPAMNASQVRTWGNRLLDEPYVCAFFMFRFNDAYFARPDIQEAIRELSEKAARLPKRPCRRG